MGNQSEVNDLPAGCMNQSEVSAHPTVCMNQSEVTALAAGCINQSVVMNPYTFHYKLKIALVINI